MWTARAERLSQRRELVTCRRTASWSFWRYGHTVNFETQLGLLAIFHITLIVLGTVIVLLLTYLVIRQGVFHGLRAHTRWIDNGKDREKIR